MGKLSRSEKKRNKLILTFCLKITRKSETEIAVLTQHKVPLEQNETQNSICSLWFRIISIISVIFTLFQQFFFVSNSAIDYGDWMNVRIFFLYLNTFVTSTRLLPSDIAILYRMHSKTHFMVVFTFGLCVHALALALVLYRISNK